jgi:hypothetical protein
MIMWEVEYTDEFGGWWAGLDESVQEAVARSVELLRQLGPALGRPHEDTVKGSRHSHMKGLRSQCGGKPIRTFFAFDPRRSAILLIGGDKTGDARFYERMVPIADKLLDTYLDELKSEGLI